MNCQVGGMICDENFRNALIQADRNPTFQAVQLRYAYNKYHAGVTSAAGSPLTGAAPKIAYAVIMNNPGASYCHSGSGLLEGCSNTSDAAGQLTCIVGTGHGSYGTNAQSEQHHCRNSYTQATGRSNAIRMAVSVLAPNQPFVLQTFEEVAAAAGVTVTAPAAH